MKDTILFGDCKDTLKTIIDQVKAENPTLRVRVAFVGYRDFGDPE